MRIMLAYMLVTTTVLAGGCKSATDKQFEREQVLIQPALEHDPTNPIELVQWWSNSDQLLRLDDDAAYMLFDGHNRFSRPAEQGRWSQQSYAMMWLEPYTTRTVEPRRVSITKIDGRAALVIPGKQPMYALPGGPPTVLEDRMVGEWAGAMGSLQLSSDLRFLLAPATDASGDAALPQIRAMQKGSWRIADQQLMLHSDIPGIDPLVMPLTVNESAVTISAPGGTMNKVNAAATGGT